MFLFCVVFAMSLRASVYMCVVVTCWERADTFVVSKCEFVTLGQVWYLIVSIPNLCTLTYIELSLKMCNDNILYIACHSNIILQNKKQNHLMVLKFKCTKFDNT